MELVKTTSSVTTAARTESKALIADEGEMERVEKKKSENLFDLNTKSGLIQFMTEPYFKSTVDDGIFMVAPVLEDPSRKMIKMPFRLTYVMQRQEYFKKDIDAVKLEVISTLREELERKLEDHFDSCLQKMDLRNYEIQSIKMCQTDNQLVDAVVRVCVDREIDGRPEPSFAPVMCYVKCPDKKFTVLSDSKNLYDLVQFKLKCAKEIAQLDFVEFSKNYLIDWMSVSAKVFNLHNRYKTPEDCELIWKWHHSPGICRDPFDFEEIEKVMNVLEEIGTEGTWHELAERMNKGRTDFDYFRMYCSLPKYEMEFKISKELRKQLVESYLSYQDINILAGKLSDAFPQMNPEIARMLYVRTLNPMLRRMHFTAIEDAILLVVMELRKDELLYNGADENFYSCIMECMPWRFTELLRERFESLFQTTHYPFTIEEDRLLIAAVELFGREWEKISQLFNSNKTRKICCTRYNLIKNWSQAQLEYNHTYEQKPLKLSYSSPLMHALYKISLVLQEWETLAHISSSQLPRTKPPTENHLHLYIRSFPRSVVQKTFDKIIDYCYQNLEYRPPLKSRLCFDRRKFTRELPISWASVLHLRNINLKPIESVENPTEFELAIYAHYNKYGLGNGKKPKIGILRHRLPSAEQLVKYPEVSRIVKMEQASLNSEPTPPPPCLLDVKKERIKKLERDEEETCCNDPLGADCMDYNHDCSYRIKEDPIKEEKLKSENVHDIQLQYNLQLNGNDEPNEDWEDREKGKRGPKSKRIRNARKEAAKARWAKKKKTDTKEEISLEAKNIKVDFDVKPSSVSLKTSAKSFESVTDLKINVKREINMTLDVKNIKVEVVNHDHNYSCKDK